MSVRRLAFVVALCGCARRDGALEVKKDPTPLDAIVDVAPPPMPASVIVAATFGHDEAGNQAVFVVTRNDGDVAIELEDELVVEVDRGGTWERVLEQYVTMGECDAELWSYGEKKGRKCKDLGPHASMKASPWWGFTCSSQCNWTCRANAMHAKGRYRFVVTKCGDPSRRFESAPVEWPGR